MIVNERLSQFSCAVFVLSSNKVPDSVIIQVQAYTDSSSPLATLQELAKGGGHPPRAYLRVYFTQISRQLLTTVFERHPH